MMVNGSYNSVNDDIFIKSCCMSINAQDVGQGQKFSCITEGVCITSEAINHNRDKLTDLNGKTHTAKLENKFANF